MSPLVGRWIDVVMFQLAAFDLCVILTDIIKQSVDGESLGVVCSLLKSVPT